MMAKLLERKIPPFCCPSIPWWAVALWALLWGCLSIAAVASSTLRRPQAPVIFALTALGWAVLAGLAYQHPLGHLRSTQLDEGAALIVAAWVALLGQLAVRLAAADHFAGDPANFDFGLSCQKVGVCKRDVSFEADTYESYGHCLQGCFAMFLFPAVVDAALQPFDEGRRSASAMVLGVLALGCSVYPIYNCIKRAMLHEEHFATSSFANNLAEWAVGFQFAVAAGLCAEQLRAGHAPASPLAGGGSSSSPSSAVRDGSSGNRPFGGPVMGRMRLAGGCAMMCVAAAAAVLFGLSWNMPPEFSTEEAAYRANGGEAEDAGAGVGMAFFPTAACGAWAAWVLGRSPEWQVGSGGESGNALQDTGLEQGPL